MSRFSFLIFAVGFALSASIVSSCDKNDAFQEELTLKQLEENAPEGVYRIEVTKLEKGTNPSASIYGRV